MHNDPHVKPDQIPVSRAANTLSLHSRQGVQDVGYRSPHGHGGQGTVSPIAVAPHPGESSRQRGTYNNTMSLTEVDLFRPNNAA